VQSTTQYDLKSQKLFLDRNYNSDAEDFHTNNLFLLMPQNVLRSYQTTDIISIPEFVLGQYTDKIFVVPVDVVPLKMMML
jgi:hypothetical protein